MNNLENVVRLITARVMVSLEQEGVDVKDSSPLKKKVFIIGQTRNQLIKVLTNKGFRIVNDLGADGTLCVANLSLSSLARVSQLSPINSQEELILTQLMAKKRVIVDDHSKLYGSVLRTCPYSIKKEIINYEEKWRSYGAVFWLDSNEKERQSKKVLSLKVIEELLQEGNSWLEINKNTIITPLGKDYLKAQEVRLIYK